MNKTCKCKSFNDNKVYLEQERSIFAKLKHKLGFGRNDFLCRYKVNAEDKDMKENKSLVIFDKNCNNKLYIIQLNKTVKVMKFDRKKPNEINVTKIILPTSIKFDNNSTNNSDIINEDEKIVDK